MMKNRIKKEFRKIDAKKFRVFFLVIAILLVVTSLYDDIGIEKNAGGWYGFAFVALLFLFLLRLAVLIYEEKMKVIGESGLVCKKCGWTPLPGLVWKALRKGECLKCGSPMNVPAEER